jgi:hypothetical protein
MTHAKVFMHKSARWKAEDGTISFIRRESGCDTVEVVRIIR